MAITSQVKDTDEDAQKKIRDQLEIFQMILEKNTSITKPNYKVLRTFYMRVMLCKPFCIESYTLTLHLGRKDSSHEGCMVWEEGSSADDIGQAGWN